MEYIGTKNYKREISVINQPVGNKKELFYRISITDRDTGNSLFVGRCQDIWLATRLSKMIVGEIEKYMEFGGEEKDEGTQRSIWEL